MNKRSFFIIGSVILAISTISCVSGKKFKSLQDTSKQFMSERDEYKTDNIGLEMANREMEAKLAVLEKQMSTVNEDIGKAETERDKAVEEFNKISAKYYELQNAQEDLVRGNVKETQKLLAELQTAQQNLQNKEDLLRQLEESLDAKK
jgi:Skp family chaperone for outer membrane proteins